MNILKKLFVQSMVISTSILFLNGISAVIQHFRGTDLVLQWYHPLTIVLAGILCAVPTILLRDYETWDRKTFRLRVALHCLALYAVIAGAGYLFGWYTDTESFLSVSVIFTAGRHRERSGIKRPNICRSAHRASRRSARQVI